MDSLDINQLVFSVSFSFVNSQREVACAMIDLDRRRIQVAEFQENEHYSVFESLLLQTNPMNTKDAKFTVICYYPELSIEREKIKDLFEQCEFEVLEKNKKDFTMPNNFEQDMDNILSRPLKQFVIESTQTKALTCVSVLVNHLGLPKEKTNFGQFLLEFLPLTKYMRLDIAAINALMIFPKPGIEQRFIASENNKQMNLVDYLDRCRTAMGSRCLRRWVKMPLQDVEEINKRLAVVQFLVTNQQFRTYIQDEFLKKVPDLDKLYAKFYKVHSSKRHNAGLNDCIKVYSLVTNMKSLVAYVNKANVKNNTEDTLHSLFLEPFLNVLEDFKKFEEMIERSIDLQKAYHGDYIVNPKFSAKLLELNKEIQKSFASIEEVRQKISAELGIDVNLTESATHTYIFEANKKYADEAFRKKGNKKFKTITVKKGQLTFTVEELQAEVAEYTHLKEQYQSEQQEVVSGYYPAMETASQCISEIDVYCSFAHVAQSAPRQFVKPIVDQNHQLILKDSRHPLLEVVDSNCIVNDLEMNHFESRLHVITGPNMGGKSTYIRQVAMCVLMAHIGSFVPCSHAQVPLMDAIISRVGASDMQLRGISTFMSEMLEASCMLKTSTQKSLIIIDELGRGTSTSEGFGIAWAIAEHIATEIKAYCLFATHFHEMTLMEHEIKGVKNYYVSCITIDNKITMQYKVRPGAVERSYGLLVAEMLNFPKQVLDDAKQKALELENFDVHVDKAGQIQETQMEEEKNFESVEEEILYLAKKSTLAQKESVVRLSEKNLSNQNMKSMVLKILKD